MDLHRDEVPSDEVWAVAVEDGYGLDIEWFLLPATASEVYRERVAWYARYMPTVDDNMDVAITRWYVELPRRRMEREDVDAYVRSALYAPPDTYPIRRLDVKRFSAQRKADA